MLYSFNAYKEIVMDTLKREVGADSVKEIVIVKTSGVKRIGVRFLVGNKFSPVLYFNTEKEIYSDNDIDEFVRWGLDTCNAPEKHTEKGLDGLLDWNDAKEHVKIRLLSGSKNEEQLKEDYQKILDLIPQVLDKREANVLILRYGLNGNNELTQRETAEKLHISRSYVSRIEKNALHKLRIRFFSS